MSPPIPVEEGSVTFRAAANLLLDRAYLLHQGFPYQLPLLHPVNISFELRIEVWGHTAAFPP